MLSSQLRLNQNYRKINIQKLQHKKYMQRVNLNKSMHIVYYSYQDCYPFLLLLFSMKVNSMELKNMLICRFFRDCKFLKKKHNNLKCGEFRSNVEVHCLFKNIQKHIKAHSMTVIFVALQYKQHKLAEP